MIKRVFVLSLISLLLISTFVIAAGSSSGNAPSSTDQSSVCQSSGGTWKMVGCNSCSYKRAVMNGEQVVCSGMVTRGCDCGTNKCWNGQACEQLSEGISANPELTTCESKESLRDRIRCRIENPSVAYREAYQSVEEACRDDRYKERCEKLYKASSYCYNQESSVERKKCFLKESGININSGGVFRAAPTEAKRNYVVLLLYELQERIEEMQEAGSVTTDEATSLIAKIVEIKKMILAGEKRADIAIKMREFKEEYKSVIGGIE